MLIEFTVGNYRSFKDKKTLRMDAASSVSEFRENLIPAGKYKLLRSAAIYGANASGKSNLLRAMGAMRNIVINSVRLVSTSELELTSFALSTTTEHKPSYFEVIFHSAGIRYRYGFEADRYAIHAEWFFETKFEKEKALFVRENDIITIEKNFREGIGLEQKTKQNTLFLSVCDQFNGEISGKIISWFSLWNEAAANDFSLLSSIDTTHRFFQNSSIKKSIIELIRQFDLGIDDIQIKQEEVVHQISSLWIAKESKYLVDRAYALHTKYEEGGMPSDIIEFRMEEFESSGTNKLFGLSGSLFDCLNRGGILIADELDAKLHPLMTRAIVRLFNDPATNPNNAQLIFATH
ncbi:MAG TPA: ATP-binding protein, partial [Saprospiraceae bacterium]|nr:ATP-binding protein [Saprospiraceae bacterium]